MSSLRGTALPGVMFRTRSARRILEVLLAAAASTAVACNNDVNFNPTGPTLPIATSPVAAMRTLVIAGTLTSEQGGAMAATVLYDGKELEGARTTCPEARGCEELELTAEARTASGNHTISFRVLSQSSETVDYMAAGTVRILRAGLGLQFTLPLEPTRVTLRSGESVDFEIEFLEGLSFE